MDISLDQTLESSYIQLCFLLKFSISNSIDFLSVLLLFFSW